MIVTPADLYRPPVVVTDWAWWQIRHPEVAGVYTYWRDRAAAEEHADRMLYRFGRRPLVVGVADLP